MNVIAVNLALNKPATQCATQGGTMNQFAASNAVDGRKDTVSCTPHTLDGYMNTVHPWWSVDLREAHDVDRVTVTNHDHAGNYLMIKENVMYYLKQLRWCMPTVHSVISL